MRLGNRSLLADIIQPQDVKELCSVLVVLSDEAAQTIAGKTLIHLCGTVI